MTDDDDQRDTARMMAANGLTVQRIALALGVSVSDVERLLQQRTPDDTDDGKR